MSSQAKAPARSPTRGSRTIREPSLIAAASILSCAGGRPRWARDGALIPVLAWHGAQET